jgi:mono/diheme cytochrome c family protein
MRRLITSILIAGIFALLGGFAVITTGAYDVAATAPHWPITRWVMETARIRSIKAHAAAIQVPPDFDDPANIPMGVEHFAAHCAVCHGAPGVRAAISPGVFIHLRPTLPKPRRFIAPPSFSGSSRTASR